MAARKARALGLKAAQVQAHTLATSRNLRWLVLSLAGAGSAFRIEAVA